MDINQLIKNKKFNFYSQDLIIQHTADYILIYLSFKLFKSSLKYLLFFGNSLLSILIPLLLSIYLVFFLFNPSFVA